MKCAELATVGLDRRPLDRSARSDHRDERGSRWRPPQDRAPSRETNTGHFALETHIGEIAPLIAAFLDWLPAQEL